MTTDRTISDNKASDIGKEISLYRERQARKKYRTPESFTKKETVTEIGVFLLITFGLMFIFGWKVYTDEETAVTGAYMLFYYLAAFSPAIGCIVTRYIFHEGFRDDILFPKFTGHFKGYFLSVILALTFGILNCIFFTIALGAGFSLKADGGALEVAAALSMYSMMTYTAVVILLGEELGWRAFLYDKLEKFAGLHGSLIIGGVIWGIWHTPALIAMGLNFGKSAPGYPVTNIFLMCIFCIFIGAMMQMLRKLTDSVIAPLIAHAIIDTICNVIGSIFLTQEHVSGDRFRIGLCMVVSSIIIGIPCWIYMAKRYVINKK